MANIIPEDDPRYPRLVKALNDISARYLNEGSKKLKMKEHRLGRVTVYEMLFYGSDPEATKENKRYSHYVIDQNGKWSPPFKNLNEVVYEVSNRLHSDSFLEANLITLIASTACFIVLFMICFFMTQGNVPLDKGATYLMTPVTALLAFFAGKATMKVGPQNNA